MQNYDDSNVLYFKKVIEDLIDAKVKSMGIPKFIAAKVVGINSDGTVNVCIPPDMKNTVTGLLNKTGETLRIGDSVELCAKNGSIANSWITIKHGL